MRKREGLSETEIETMEEGGKGEPFKKLRLGAAYQEGLRGITACLQKMRGRNEDNCGDYRF